MRPPPSIVRAALVATLASALVACSARARGTAATTPETARAPLPGPAAEPFFVDWELLAEQVPGLASNAGPRGGAPFLAHSEDLEARVAAWLARAGRPVPPILLVHGFSVRVGAKPAACADLLFDVDAERAALGGEESRAIRGYVAGTDLVRVASMGLLRRGQGPFRFDFRWAWRGTRRARADGVVMLRYDLLDDPPPERVGTFGGVAWIEPDGDGSRITEVLVLGARIALPFFLKKSGREAVGSILATRARRLAERLR